MRGCGSERSRPDSDKQAISSEGLKKNTKNVTYGSVPPDRDSKREPFEQNVVLWLEEASLMKQIFYNT